MTMFQTNIHWSDSVDDMEIGPATHEMCAFCNRFFCSYSHCCNRDCTSGNYKHAGGTNVSRKRKDPLGNPDTEAEAAAAAVEIAVQQAETQNKEAQLGDATALTTTALARVLACIVH